MKIDEWERRFESILEENKNIRAEVKEYIKIHQEYHDRQEEKHDTKHRDIESKIIVADKRILDIEKSQIESLGKLNGMDEKLDIIKKMLDAKGKLSAASIVAISTISSAGIYFLGNIIVALINKGVKP